MLSLAGLDISLAAASRCCQLHRLHHHHDIMIVKSSYTLEMFSGNSHGQNYTKSFPDLHKCAWESISNNFVTKGKALIFLRVWSFGMDAPYVLSAAGLGNLCSILEKSPKRRLTKRTEQAREKVRLSLRLGLHILLISRNANP